MSTPSVSPLSPHDEVLDQILARLDALEATTRPLAQAVRDGPALVGALVDEVDQRYGQGAPMPDVDALLERAPHLAAQAVNRRTLEALEHILSRLDALDEATRLLAQAVRDGPALVGALVDEVDQRYGQGAPMPDVDALLERAPHLAAQAVNRRTLEALEHILSRLDALDEATRLLAQAVRDGPALVGALVDEVDRFALREEVDLDTATTNVVDALTRLVHLVQSPAFQALLDALDPTTLEFAARAAQATREAYTERQRIEQVGPWGMLRALCNADVRRALGFALAMLRRLGRALSA